MSHPIHDPAPFDDPSWEDDPRWEDDESPVDLALPPGRRAALAAAVATGLRRDGCDHTLPGTRAWAAGEGVEWPSLRRRLEGNGGYCDREVLLNVLPDEAEPD